MFHDFATARSRSSSTGKATGIRSKKRCTRGSTSATEIAITDTLGEPRPRNLFSAGNSSRQGSHHVAKKCTRTVRPLNVFKATLLPFRSCKEKSGFEDSPVGFNSLASAVEYGGHNNTQETASSTIRSEPDVDLNCAPRNSGADLSVTCHSWNAARGDVN